ncbi:hypothetical protein BsWGS_02655 [Bradybaena similaris]
MATSYMKLHGADFRIYSKAEIQQLSVKEIVNPQTFDNLQNPMIGGLHDPMLGPCNRFERCDSCGQSEVKCPGHFGHIKLPVLVFNPLLFKTLVQLLKGTCLSCHRVNLSQLYLQLYSFQLELLQKGFLTQAQDLAERFLHSEQPESEVIKEMKEFVKETFERAHRDERVLSKNLLTETQNTVRSILNLFSTLKPTCRHCQTRNRTLKAEYNRTIVGVLIEDKVSKRKIHLISQAELDQKDMMAVPEEEVDMEMKPTDEASEDVPDAGEIEGDVQTEITHFLKSKHKRCIMSPNIARDQLRKVWQHDKDFLQKLYPFLASVKESEFPVDIFFLDTIPVPPTRYRPLSVLKGRKFEHPQTSNLTAVLKESLALQELIKKIEDPQKGTAKGLAVPETSESLTAHMHKIMASWLRLQARVNVVLDSDLDTLSKEKSSGLRQLLEKKEGLLRMHMMGKRVNFAARSVISPDPYIATNEIGIPMVFAYKLTFPQRVTPRNFHILKEMVINGPNQYPGASSVMSADGMVVHLNPSDLRQRVAVAKQLLVNDTKVTGTKTVNRHLINGDYLLLNRQPTLHRPSIQAHKARVLPDIKTLRMNYSNCKAYNADFDGDEMNAHFPQCELSRAEASVLARTDFQYLVPKDGTPLAGLIQDHVVAGVALTIRGRFFTRQDYTGLVWNALSDSKERISTLPPAIMKPHPLWSGKQIVSTVLLHLIPKGAAAISLRSKSKIPEKNWIHYEPSYKKRLPLTNATVDTDGLGESTVFISQGELLQGVLDKAHYGPSSYSLVHCCYELYGGEVAGRLLTCLGRLFTSFIQITGFSLGSGDILVQKKAEKKRKSFIKKSQHVGKAAIMKALGLSEADASESDLLMELKQAQFEKGGLRMAEIDMYMKGETDKVQDEIARSIMPMRLEKGFRENSLQLMVQSGAKGSPVNCMQISCLLGQIELEGRRPPLMLSGRSLPSFLPYDVSPKAGGFVTGRFLTGIKPQEYFFHCMAGREGLIDTAVKTSRSGYLQRCLVKHLEGIMVNYDLTVRDSDGGVIQFYYGEDGLDPICCPFLMPSQFPFLTENLLAVLRTSKENPWQTVKHSKEVRRTWKKISKWRAQNSELEKWTNRDSNFLKFCQSEVAPSVSQSEERAIVKDGKYLGRSKATRKFCEAWDSLGAEDKEKMKKGMVCPEPVMSKYLPHSQPDVMSERFRHLLNVYCKKGFSKVVSQLSQNLNPEAFKSAVNRKVVQSMAQPGEAVGLICAQSVGEPSTQMTLNTFHFAGRGEMNVTLGIPRLREILMTASTNIKTPSMDIPVLPVPDAKSLAENLKRHLNRITLDQVLQNVKVKISTKRFNFENYRVFEAKFKFLNRREYADLTNLTPRKILTFVVKRFLLQVDMAIKKENAVMDKTTLLSSGRLKRSGNADREEKEDTEEDKIPDAINKEEEPNDGDAATVKEQQQQLDTQEYEGEEEERKEVIPNDDGDADENIDEIGVKLENNSDDDDDDVKDSSYEAPQIQEMNQEDKDLITEALSHAFVESFKLDERKHRWCTVTFSYIQSNLQLDIKLLLEKTIRSAVIHQVKGINRALVSEEKEDGESVLHLKTEGVNILEMFKYPEILDLNKMYSNCIHTMAQTYGIEAANRVIIKEIQNVFGVYGITVDYRHLSLLADYMTCRGQYDAFNRRDIMYNTSPLQKMTFETTMNFLLSACVSGQKDDLQSPSSRLVVGRPVGVGTASFDVLDVL